MNRQPTEWDELFANHTSDKFLVSRIYKQLLQFNNQRQRTKLTNGQRLSIDISTIKIPMVNKHMKRCWTSFAIKEMQIKTTG